MVCLVWALVSPGPNLLFGHEPGEGLFLFARDGGSNNEMFIMYDDNT
jgi:hypothetical protein